jgi:hypothetical protein
MTASIQTFRQKAYRETKVFLVVALYLWVIFALMIQYKSVILAEEHVNLETHGLAIINALALAKVIVTARVLNLGELADDVPLVYPTLLKSALFSLLLAGFKILEAFAIGHFRKQTFQQSIVELGGGTLKGILCLTMIMFVVLVPFFACGELNRVLGGAKLGQLFFHRRTIEGEPTIVR